MTNSCGGSLRNSSIIILQTFLLWTHTRSLLKACTVLPTQVDSLLFNVMDQNTNTDTTGELADDNHGWYMELVGILCWVVELGL